eukprot:4987914-Amphidinium_carterae.1
MLGTKTGFVQSQTIACQSTFLAHMAGHAPYKTHRTHIEDAQRPCKSAVLWRRFIAKASKCCKLQVSGKRKRWNAHFLNFFVNNPNDEEMLP